jgi:serine/threonine-protein kinase
LVDLLACLKAALADRYTIERELGRGGMATVYFARDLKHDRRVALKVLHPELAATLGPERFEREIKLAARLQHPHILTVFDSGDAAGQLWYTMPFVEGEALRERLARERQLPLDDALQITREVADALGYAHSQGVIHRDIKPENVLLSRGHALVADFGVARALQSAAGERLTATGMAVGTPAYMSPEQASAERDLDARSDLYSLGCVLYEMLAGEPPYTGPSAQAVLAKRFSEPIPHIRTLRESVPEVIEQAVRKALAKAPVDRYSSVAAFTEALRLTSPLRTAGTDRFALLHVVRRRPLLAALLVGLLIGGVLFTWRRTRGEALGAGSARLAVLPFENLGDSADAYFADGVTDEVRGKLASLVGLQVIASTSSNQYRHTTKRPGEIARELGVRYLLLGRVRWAKSPGGVSRVRVDPELILVGDIAGPTTKWEQPFDAPLTDVFQVQADIAGKVAQALNIALLATQRDALQSQPTRNLQAYDYYLRGKVLEERLYTADQFREAAKLFQQAVELDSAFALAYARLSYADAWLYWNWGRPEPARLALAKAAADRALALQPDLSEAHLALGYYYYYGSRNYDRALQEFGTALRREPNNSELIAAMAFVARRQGRWAAAAKGLAQAVELDPRSALNVGTLAYVYAAMRRYPEAMKTVDWVIAIDPEQPEWYGAKALVFLLAEGDLAKARETMHQATRRIGAERVAIWRATNAWFVSGSSVPLDADVESVLRQLSLTSAITDTAGFYDLKASLVRGEQPKLALVYEDSARVSLERELARDDDPELHAKLGLVDARLGRRDEAVREARRAVELLPVSTGTAYTLIRQAQVDVLVGNYDAAIERLEYLLSIPGYMSRKLLQVDPLYQPLRASPRFKKLMAGGS